MFLEEVFYSAIVLIVFLLVLRLIDAVSKNNGE